MYKQVNELTEPSVNHMLIRFVITFHYILKSSLEYSPQDVGIRNTPPEFTTGFLKHLISGHFQMKGIEDKGWTHSQLTPKGGLPSIGSAC